jgi:aspartate racemase
MKVIGLLGGMSWESTAIYYRIINEQIHKKLGGLHSGRIVVVSLDFAEVEELQRRGDWEAASEILIDGAKRLAAAGADCILICTNTMHKVASEIAAAVPIPLIHIADATADTLLERRITKVGLLGTRFTMEEDFYKSRLRSRGFEVAIPDELDRGLVHSIIYTELCQGLVQLTSREQFQRIIRKLEVEGCEGVILGCTEIGMLIGENDSALPIFDTTRIHAEAGVEFALKVQSHSIST